MSKLTRRGRVVFRLIPALLGAGILGAGIYLTAARLWWIGAGYCIGSLLECVPLDLISLGR